MFWCIESEEQLLKFSSYNFDNVYIEPIYENDNFHPKLSNIIALYLRPFKSSSGFIINICHPEAFKLDIKSICSIIVPNIGKIYTSDGKRWNYNKIIDKPTRCFKMANYLNNGQVLDVNKFNTTSHNHFYEKYRYKNDVNKIIPLVKHLEKFDNYFNSIKIGKLNFNTLYFKFYNNFANKIFYTIENKGIKIDIDIFDKIYNPKFKELSIKDNIIYTEYNLYTQTGRPSNAFNNINLGALNKTDGSREAILPSNDLLLEFDFKSYHPRILCELINYKFDDVDIHTHLGKQYYDVEKLTDDQYHDAKKLTFKYMYTDFIPPELVHIDFFIEVKKYKDSLWSKYKKEGHIESPISGKPIRGIEQKTQLLPYILQVYETENNIMILNEIVNLLKNKKTKIIHYCYDSFLFDLSKKDGKKLINDLKTIMYRTGYQFSMSAGFNYSQMENLV